MGNSFEQRIRERAYEIWEARIYWGMYLRFEKGELREITAEDDWLEAEREIKQGIDYGKEVE